jgi:hypothetical protein
MLIVPQRRGHVEHPSYSARLVEEKVGLSASLEDIDLIRWSAALVRKSL